MALATTTVCFVELPGDFVSQRCFRKQGKSFQIMKHFVINKTFYVTRRTFRDRSIKESNKFCCTLSLFVILGNELKF